MTSETQTPLSTFPETPHISVIKDQTQQKVSRVEAELSAIKSYFKWELSTSSSKIESLTTSLNGALKKLENHPHKCCSIDEDNQLFLQKELLSKDDIIKSIVKTQTAILDSISNTASDKQTPTTLSVSPNLCETQQLTSSTALNTATNRKSTRTAYVTNATFEANTERQHEKDICRKSH